MSAERLNLTPEEVALMDRFAAASLNGLNADSECRLNPAESADVAYDDALAMIARRRLVLAEHAAPQQAIDESSFASMPAGSLAHPIWNGPGEPGSVMPIPADSCMSQATIRPPLVIHQPKTATRTDNPKPNPIILSNDSSTPQLPADIPPPPEGFIYWGKGPLNSTANFHEQIDVAGYRDATGWSNGRAGTASCHYALRSGSDIARRNGLEGGAR